MLLPEQIKNEPSPRSCLDTRGIAVEEINGLFRNEDYSVKDANERFDRNTKDYYCHDEMFGNYVNVNIHIDVPTQYAFTYIKNVHSMEEWSYGIRNLRHVGDGIYQGKDRWANDTKVFVKTAHYHDGHAVDYFMAWDQRENLWMRLYFRFMDAKLAINKTGTIMSTFLPKHPFYDRGLQNLPAWLKQDQNREGRPWIGDFYRCFHAWRKIESDNLRYILEYRYHYRK